MSPRANFKFPGSAVCFWVHRPHTALFLGPQAQTTADFTDTIAKDFLFDGCVMPCIWTPDLNRGSHQVLLAPKQAFREACVSPRALGSSDSGGEGWACRWQQNTSFQGCLSKVSALTRARPVRQPCRQVYGCRSQPGRWGPADTARPPQASGIVVRVELTPLPAPCASLICFWSATRLTCALTLSPGAVHQ